jgi:hypothetical protein
MILIPLSTILLVLGVVSPLGIWPGIAGWCITGLSMMPFITKSIKRDPLPAMFAPMYLIPRAFVQCLGVILGLTYALQNSSQSGKRLDGSSLREVSRD